MNLQGEYVYVVEESIKSGERVYKVGESLNILHTMSLYEKGSQLHILVHVNNSYKAHQEILWQLMKYDCVTQRDDIGREYFQGNLYTILNVVSLNAIMFGKFKELKYTARLDEHDSDSVRESKDTSKKTENVVNTKPDNNIEDPVVIISEYLTDNIRTLEGQTIKAISFYKTVMNESNLPMRFHYSMFTEIMRKHKIKECDTVHGPVFIFPVVQSKKENVMGFINANDGKSYYTLEEAIESHPEGSYRIYKR
jgi:hypothetical protein